MKICRELTEWLCLSRIGTSLYMHLPGDCREQHCHLCDLPLDAMNEHVPCLHWLVTPYCKEDRIRRVLENYSAGDAMRYLLVWTLSQMRKPAANNLSCNVGAASIDIRIGFRRRDWRLQVDENDAALFEYVNRRTGFGFRLPVLLFEGEDAALRQLARYGEGGLPVWAMEPAPVPAVPENRPAARMVRAGHGADALASTA